MKFIKSSTSNIQFREYCEKNKISYWRRLKIFIHRIRPKKVDPYFPRIIKLIWNSITSNFNVLVSNQQFR
jgi:hypothetical protein